jgi:serine/threonine protein kinase
MEFRVPRVALNNDPREFDLETTPVTEDHEFSTELCNRRWIESNYITRGSYASIYRVTRNHLMKICNPSLYNFLEVAMETFILSNISHSCILRANYITHIRTSIVFVLPCYESTLEMTSPETKSEQTSVMRQLASAVNHLHAHHILHLDLCPKNVLVNVVNGRYQISVCDFSLSVLCPGTTHKTKEPKITVNYRPYENLRGSRVYSVKSDVWSLGMIFYRIIHGTELIRLITVPTDAPVEYDFELSTVFEIEQMKAWDRWPSTKNSLIRSMLELDNTTRVDSYDVCRTLNVQTMPLKEFRTSPPGHVEHWRTVQKHFRNLDQTTLTQVEKLYESLVCESDADVFMSCYGLIKSMTSGVSKLRTERGFQQFTRVIEIIMRTKGKILDYGL